MFSCVCNPVPLLRQPFRARAGKPLLQGLCRYPSMKRKAAKRVLPGSTRGSSSRTGKVAKTSEPLEADKTATGSKAASRRRLSRRDTDDQVERIVAKKLKPFFPSELIEGIVHADGSTPRSTIADGLRNSKSAGEYLKQEFWSNFFLKFPFEKGLASIVPEPSGHYDIRDEVLEAIAPLARQEPSPAHYLESHLLPEICERLERGRALRHHHGFAGIAISER